MKTTKRIIAVKKLKSGFSSKVVDNEIEIFRLEYFAKPFFYFFKIILKNFSKKITSSQKYC